MIQSAANTRAGLIQYALKSKRWRDTFCARSIAKVVERTSRYVDVQPKGQSWIRLPTDPQSSRPTDSDCRWGWLVLLFCKRTSTFRIC